MRQLGLIGGQNGQGKLPAGKLVVLSNLEDSANSFCRRITGHGTQVDMIYTKTAFQHAFADVLGTKNLSYADMEVFLKFLSRDKGLIKYDGETVKIKGPGEASVSDITTEDTTIASLKSLIVDLNIQTNDLSQRVDLLAAKAREAVSCKNRASALSILRTKKLAESNLTKKAATLAQLEEVLAKIEQAADHVELVRVMEGSTRVLSALNSEVGGVDRVDAVVDQLREQMGLVDEVGNIIAEVGQSAGVVDETEVDNELETMELEDKQKREEQEREENADKERRDAAKTRSRLDALEEAERHAVFPNNATVNEARVESGTTDAVEESIRDMKRLSLKEEPTEVPA